VAQGVGPEFKPQYKKMAISYFPPRKIKIVIDFHFWDLKGKQLFIYLFIYLMDWGLNAQLHTCKVGSSAT
jgi:hypothetical protein